jgi:hypothetical protein
MDRAFSPQGSWRITNLGRWPRLGWNGMGLWPVGMALRLWPVGMALSLWLGGMALRLWPVGMALSLWPVGFPRQRLIQSYRLIGFPRQRRTAIPAWGIAPGKCPALAKGLKARTISRADGSGLLPSRFLANHEPRPMA